MKRSFDSSIQHARSKYLPESSKVNTQLTNKTTGLIEGMMQNIRKNLSGVGDLAGSVKKGLGKVASARNSIRTFAQNQKHGGTFGAIAQTGAFDPKGDSQQVRAKWDKMNQGAQAAWHQKGQDFRPPMEGKDYFYNYTMQQRADKYGPGDEEESDSTQQTGGAPQQSPSQQEQAAREAFRNNPGVNQQATANGMDEDAYVAFVKAQQQ